MGKGVGYFGAICPCREWFVKSPSKQLFTHAVSMPRWRRMGKLKVSKAKMRAAYSRCMSSLKKAPFAKLALKHRVLKNAVLRAASNCAVDRMAGVRGRKPHLNRRLVKQQICRVAKMLVRRANPDATLCR